MGKPITARVVSSHEPEPPKLPPLPTHIELWAHRGHARWDIGQFYSENDANDAQKRSISAGATSHILAVTQPTPPREPTDAEVCEIIRENIPNARTESDYDIKNVIRPAVFACVRAALRKAGG